jgi:hypothetical protein
MADLTEIRETHRVHKHAAAAIIRASRPHEPASAADPRGDTLAIADCALDRSQLEAQQARYRELGRHVASVRRLAGERQLSITVESTDQDLALDALFDAFSSSAGSDRCRVR